MEPRMSEANSNSIYFSIFYNIEMKKTAIRTDEKLWEKIKKKLRKSSKYGGPGWNARKSQAAVRMYLQAGGKYKKGVSQKQTSLHKWSQEKWGYISKSKNTRYLPLKVREKLTPAEIKKETKLKRNKKGKRIPYSTSVSKKMRKARIY
jgi:hypothetical protein